MSGRARRRRARAQAADAPEQMGPRNRPETEAREPGEMHIAWCPSDDGGCGWYRLIEPAREIDPAYLSRVDNPGQRVAAKNRLATCIPGHTEAEVAECDVVVFQRLYGARDIDTMVRLKRRGCLVVLDLDDAIWTLGPETLSPVYPVFMQGGKLEWMTMAMAEADLVTVSTEPLAQEVGRFAEHVEVLPNRLSVDRFDEAGDRRRFARGGAEVVIGYAGSATHERDIRMVMPELVEIDREFPGKLLWRVMGDATRVWRWFEGLKENRLEVYPFVDFPSYPGQLKALDLDIGICPLWPHEFNRHKSPIKALEYSLAGAAVVASDYGPYSILRDGEDALLAKTPAEWGAALRALIAKPAKRKALAEALAARTRQEFALAGEGRRWVDVFWKHLRRVREQEERWLFAHRRWFDPEKPKTLERIALAERRARS